MAHKIPRQRFELLAGRALETLPPEFARYLSNVTVTVEDEPTEEDAAATGTPRGELLGLFDGVSYPDQGGFFDLPPPLPDRIVLFRKNLEKICSSEQELVDEIRKTIVHEVGHYFGLGEEDLEKYEESS